MVDLNKYFDRIYCINLDKRPDRYEIVKKEFEKFGINNVIRYSGIDGNTITNTTELLNGEVGILKTHLNIIQQCKDDNLNNVLILEDDVYFTDEINKIDDYINMVPKNWDLLYFGGNHLKSPTIINEKVSKLNSTVALQCVAINKTLFDTILEILPEMKVQVDNYYAHLQTAYNGYCFTPNMAKQTVGFSDIQNRNVDYRHFFNR